MNKSTLWIGIVISFICFIFILFTSLSAVEEMVKFTRPTMFFGLSVAQWGCIAISLLIFVANIFFGASAVSLGYKTVSKKLRWWLGITLITGIGFVLVANVVPTSIKVFVDSAEKDRMKELVEIQKSKDTRYSLISQYQEQIAICDSLIVVRNKQMTEYNNKEMFGHAREVGNKIQEISKERSEWIEKIANLNESLEKDYEQKNEMVETELTEKSWLEKVDSLPVGTILGVSWKLIIKLLIAVSSAGVFPIVEFALSKVIGYALACLIILYGADRKEKDLGKWESELKAFSESLRLEKDRLEKESETLKKEALKLNEMRVEIEKEMEFKEGSLKIERDRLEKEKERLFKERKSFEEVIEKQRLKLFLKGSLKGKLRGSLKGNEEPFKEYSKGLSEGLLNTPLNASENDGLKGNLKGELKGQTRGEKFIELIQKNPEISQSELAKEIGRTGGWVSTFANRYIGKGLISVERESGKSGKWTILDLEKAFEFARNGGGGGTIENNVARDGGSGE
jgi:hypothetical protein